MVTCITIQLLHPINFEYWMKPFGILLHRVLMFHLQTITTSLLECLLFCNQNYEFIKSINSCAIVDVFVVTKHTHTTCIWLNRTKESNKKLWIFTVTLANLSAFGNCISKWSERNGIHLLRWRYQLTAYFWSFHYILFGEFIFTVYKNPCICMIVRWTELDCEYLKWKEKERRNNWNISFECRLNFQNIWWIEE